MQHPMVNNVHAIPKVKNSTCSTQSKKSLHATPKVKKSTCNTYS